MRRALASSSLLFLGFNLNDWDFRVLFRSLMQEQSSQRRRKQLHVAVQVDPDDDQITDPERARVYREVLRGFSENDVSIYWGSCEDFLSRAESALAGAAAMISATNPYVGPRAFQTGERLYGRDREARVGRPLDRWSVLF